MNTVRRSGQMVVMVQGFNRSDIGSQENGSSVNERKEKKRKERRTIGITFHLFLPHFAQR